MGKTIVKTIIVAQDVRKSAASCAGRAAVGGLLLGALAMPLAPIGLIAGGISGKNKHTTTFQIVYSDGSQETKVVKNNSGEFKKFCSYLTKL